MASSFGAGKWNEPMAPEPSITSTPTFAARAQRSELRRAAIWATALGALLVITICRRAAGGRVMSHDAMFWPTLGAIVLAMVLQLGLLRALRVANKTGSVLPAFVWRGSVAFDLTVVMALLLISATASPRGPVPALSAPPLLLLPLVVMLSVLRLRPTFTLLTGLIAAAFHAALVLRAIAVTDAPGAEYPVYFAYSAMLACIAVAGMLVASAVRGHVVEAASEAGARERADLALAGMRRDLAVARDIQTGLLPVAPPRFDGFEFAGMNRPADLTGGDYYDWQVTPDGRLVAVIADVSGHGIGPALVMAVCRAYARASAALITDPSVLVRRVNELIQDDLPADRFITFAIALIEPDGAVQLVSAGHGPSLLYSARDRTVQRFGGDGLPLGVSPCESYEPATRFEMEESDVLVMLTDGFFEWQRGSDGEAFGIKRLEAVLAAEAGRSAEEIVRALDGAVRSFAVGSTQPDDMTAVVIRRTQRTAGECRTAQPQHLATQGSNGAPDEAHPVRV
jgi:serine phosphatase RsbU (regulator of sigma subunit)